MLSVSLENPFLDCCSYSSSLTGSQVFLGLASDSACPLKKEREKATTILTAILTTSLP